MTDEDGERYGLVVDYLNEIAKYTGWKYEYIDTDNNSVVDKFFRGKIRPNGRYLLFGRIRELFCLSRI